MKADPSLLRARAILIDPVMQIATSSSVRGVRVMSSSGFYEDQMVIATSTSTSTSILYAALLLSLTNDAHFSSVIGNVSDISLT